MSIAQPTDSELRELIDLSGPREIKLAYYVSDPIRLSEAHVNLLLLNHLGNPQGPTLRESLAKEIKNAAENFLRDIEIQSAPTPRESLKQLGLIESAARRLQAALKWDGESIETIPLDPAGTWLRQAAEGYGRGIKLPADLDDFSTLDWGIRVLPRAIAGVRLLEIWAHGARAIVEAIQSERKARIKDRLPVRGKHALRVAVQRLVLCWIHAYGKPPGRGFNEATGEADGPFIRFAKAFFFAMRESVTDFQRSKHPGLRAKLLQPSPNTIRQYLGNVLNRLHRREETPRRSGVRAGGWS